MRLTTFLFSFLLMLSYAAQAQVSIGLVGFPQISNLTSKAIRQDPIMENQLSFGAGGGATITYSFSDQLGIQVGGFYSSQNQKIKSTYTIAGQELSHGSKKRFDYIKIPLLLRITRPLGNANFVIFAGPQFSYLIKYDGGMIVYKENEYFDLPNTPAGNDFYKKYNIDATAGLGLEFPIARYIELTSALKADYSVTNAQNSSAVYNNSKVSDLNGGDQARNITCALLLGVNFKFKSPNDLISPSNKFRRARVHYKKKRY